jgi:hypothetical protein
LAFTSYPQHLEVASALLRITIIKLMDAMAQCATISSRPTGAAKNPFPARIINR